MGCSWDLLAFSARRLVEGGQEIAHYYLLRKRNNPHYTTSKENGFLCEILRLINKSFKNIFKITENKEQQYVNRKEF